MLDKLNEAKQKASDSIDKTIQIKRKSDESPADQPTTETDHESLNKKSKTNENNDANIISMHAKYSK